MPEQRLVVRLRDVRRIADDEVELAVAMEVAELPVLLGLKRENVVDVMGRDDRLLRALFRFDVEAAFRLRLSILITPRRIAAGRAHDPHPSGQARHLKKQLISVR